MHLVLQSIVAIIVRHQRLSFSLIFLFPAALFLPQRIYRYFHTTVTVLAPADLPEGAIGYSLGLQLKGKTIYKFSQRLRRSAWAVAALLVLAAGMVGCIVGNANPIPKTAILEFPDPTCHAGANNLMLFVHGWRGDRLQTWQAFPDLVCQDPAFEDFEVVSLAYPTYIVERNLTLEETASWIQGHLKHKVVRYQEIVIVAHSIGGLVAREIVLQENLFSAEDAKKIRIMIEIATPHLGAARYAQLLPQLGLQGGDVVEQVRPNSQFLRTLRTHWNSLQIKPRTECISGPQDWLVSEDSAIADCLHFDLIPGADHRALAKPASRADDRYEIPMGSVQEEIRTFQHP